MGIRHLRLVPPLPTEWGAALDGELITTVRRDGDRAVVVEAGDGVVRVRFLRCLGGRWQTTTDATLEAVVVERRALDAAGDPDPIPDPLPGGALALARAA